jgi:hypothetical protein
MKTLVKPTRLEDPVECFLSDEVLSHPTGHSPSPSIGSSANPNSEEDSMMLEEFNWLRSDSQSSGIGWPYLAIFAIVLAVFVLPAGNQTQVAAAFEVSEERVVSAASYCLTGMKYLLVVGFLGILYKKGQAYLHGRKFKRG